ncbi:flagellar biosynthetic protein FliO [Psychrobacillus sp. FSL H8-0484]|uniref:flagellar biosynthetic protein FliO n=1 Tax=Psychrobacillus sp. FSL H8-0484 TaxID=2921390 RepID=UPI0030FACB19
MLRKNTLVICIVSILLFLPFQMDAKASVDPNETTEEYLKRTKTEKDNEREPVIDTDTEKEIKTSPDKSGVSLNAWDYIKMVFALLFVIFLLYGLLRFVNSRNRSFQHNQLIQNLGGAGVGQGKSIQLMQVGNTLYLVGIGEDITLLKEITDPEEIEKLTKIYEDKLGNSKTVPYITELYNRLKENVSSKAKSNEKKGPSFNETFQKRLQEIKKDRSEVLEDWKTKEREKNE